MKIGDLVKYSAPSGFKFESWLGIIIRELPGNAYYKTVQWVNSETGRLETSSHKPKDLRIVNENR